MMWGGALQLKEGLKLTGKDKKKKGRKKSTRKGGARMAKLTGGAWPGGKTTENKKNDGSPTSINTLNNTEKV